MAQGSESDIHALLEKDFGVDTRSLEFKTTTDQIGALTTDVTRVRSYPYLREGITVGGAIYDVKTGTIKPVDC
jgi:carbonic anhydrase